MSQGSQSQRQTFVRVRAIKVTDSLAHHREAIQETLLHHLKIRDTHQVRHQVRVEIGSLKARTERAWVMRESLVQRTSQNRQGTKLYRPNRQRRINQFLWTK